MSNILKPVSHILILLLLIGCQSENSSDRASSLMSASLSKAKGFLVTVTGDQCQSDNAIKEMLNSSGFFESDAVRGVRPMQGITTAISGAHKTETLDDRIVCSAVFEVSGERMTLIGSIFSATWTSDEDFMLSELLGGWSGQEQEGAANPFTLLAEGLDFGVSLMTALHKLDDDTDRTPTTYESSIEFSIDKIQHDLIAWAWHAGESPGYQAARDLKRVLKEHPDEI